MSSAAWCDTTQPFKIRAALLVANLTTEEKAGLFIATAQPVPRVGWSVQATPVRQRSCGVPLHPIARTRRKHAPSHAWGLWRTHPKLTTCALCRPGYNWWSEALHGVARESIATSFPEICGLATSFNASLFHAVGSAIGLEVSTISRKVDGASRKAERRCGAETGFARRLLLPCCVVAGGSLCCADGIFCASRRED